jgi:hypothetical protein
MADFILAALPWIVIGIAAAVAAAYLGGKRRKVKVNANRETDETTSKNENGTDNYMSIGMCLGMCCGSALGVTGIFPSSYGAAFGMLIGMLVGMFIKKNEMHLSGLPVGELIFCMTDKKGGVKRNETMVSYFCYYRRIAVEHHVRRHGL